MAGMVGRYAIDAFNRKDFIDPYKIDIVSNRKIELVLFFNRLKKLKYQFFHTL